MSVLQKFLLVGEISVCTVAGLVVMAVLMAVIRALMSPKTAPFNPSTDVAIAEARAAAEWWPHRVLVALDVFINVFVLFGRQGETISAHAYITSLEGKIWGTWMNKWLGWIQPNHGQLAASGDLQRAMAEVARLRRTLGV
jgi:hypothetical protein